MFHAATFFIFVFFMVGVATVAGLVVDPIISWFQRRHHGKKET
jgi:hypothetical protein